MKSPLVLQSVSSLKDWRRSLSDDSSIGLVPTMGALHQGHKTLLNTAKKENKLTVLSIFVNPTQFNNQEDFVKYPTTWEADVACAQECQVDVIFSPDRSQLYTDGYRYRMIETEFSKKLCGASRPGHFDGVLTIVMKLFQLVEPHRAYFGEKDFQQLTLIREMTEAFFLPIEIRPIPTVRDASGLALSSRNQRLSEAGKILASQFYQILKTSRSPAEAKQRLAGSPIEIDYIEDFNQRRFGAFFVEGVRLIDNIQID